MQRRAAGRGRHKHCILCAHGSFRFRWFQCIFVGSSTHFVRSQLTRNSPTVQLHVSKDSEGTPVPVIGVDDVARGIAFLASDEAKMINGAMIPIDNAWSTI
jgi:NAD(P)-dependent dehydrogenase (short-subunit alcohol dehydrogenase family)